MEAGRVGQPQSSDWRQDVTAVLATVRLDADLVAAADRATELIVVTDELPGDAGHYVAAVRSALASTDPLGSLVSPPRSEGAVRKLLRLLAERLEDWQEGGPAVVELPLEAWRPEEPPRPVAQLEWDWPQVARWLGVTFHEAPDPLGEIRLAVLRLSSGQVVALLRSVDSPAPGTTLMQPGSRPALEVLEEFLADTRLPRAAVSSEPYRSY